MSKRSSHAVRVTAQQKTGTPSKLRKQFNTLVKELEAERARLSEWHATLPQIRADADRELNPLYEQAWQQHKALTLLLDTQLDAKGLTKKQREKLGDVVCDMAADLLEDRDDDDLKRIVEELAGDDLDLDDEDEKELLKGMMEDMFGADAAAEVDTSGSTDEVYQAFAEKMAERMQQEEREHEEHLAKKAGNKKTSSRTARHQAEEVKLQQSVRDIFRKLTSALHPDREQDPAERARKTALMQRVNVAYGANDLLGLLELQLEIDQIDRGSLDRLDDVRIKQYNTILNQQLQDLRHEVMSFEISLLHEFDLPLFPRPTPKSVENMLKDDIAQMRHTLQQIAQNLVNLKDVKKLKAWLKTVELYDPDDDPDLDWLR